MVDLSEAKSNSVNSIKLQMEVNVHGKHTPTPTLHVYIHSAPKGFSGWPYSCVCTVY